jgi:hypothetical protein
MPTSGLAKHTNIHASKLNCLKILRPLDSLRLASLVRFEVQTWSFLSTVERLVFHEQHSSSKT